MIIVVLYIINNLLFVVFNDIYYIFSNYKVSIFYTITKTQ